MLLVRGRAAAIPFPLVISAIMGIEMILNRTTAAFAAVGLGFGAVDLVVLVLSVVTLILLLSATAML